MTILTTLSTDLRANQGQDYLTGSREMARLLHSRNDVQGAKDVIEQAVNKFPDFAHTGGEDRIELYRNAPCLDAFAHWTYWNELYLSQGFKTI